MTRELVGAMHTNFFKRKALPLTIVLGAVLTFLRVGFAEVPKGAQKTPQELSAHPSPPDPKRASANSEETKPVNGSQFHGEAVHDAKGSLLFIAENKSQTHSQDNYVMVHVKGIKKDASARALGRIRVAVWNEKTSYAKEGVRPYRASSFWAKDAVNDELIFKIGGFKIGENLSFFAHFDEKNSGTVARNFLGIPKEQFVFSNAKNQGIGKGLKREGLSAPKFENTLVKFLKPGQIIELNF